VTTCVTESCVYFARFSNVKHVQLLPLIYLFLMDGVYMRIDRSMCLPNGECLPLSYHLYVYDCPYSCLLYVNHKEWQWGFWLKWLLCSRGLSHMIYKYYCGSNVWFLKTLGISGWRAWRAAEIEIY